MKRSNENTSADIARCFIELYELNSPILTQKTNLGLVALEWFKHNKKYDTSKLKLTINKNDSSEIDRIKDKILSFEKRYPECDKLLSVLLSGILNHSKDIDIEELKKILKSVSVKSKDEAERLLRALIEDFDIAEDSDVTPKTIRELLIEMFVKEEINRIGVLDENKGLLMSDILQVKKKHRDKLYIYSEVYNSTEYLLVRLMMLIAEFYNCEITQKYILKDPFNGANGDLDLVLFDMPLNYSSLFFRRSSEYEYKYGVPTRNNADWLFCQIALAHLNENGKAVVIGSKGTLVRSNEVKIRKKIIQDDLIESVITLPEKLYEKTSISKEVIVFNRNKPANRKNKILFINAKDFYYKFGDASISDPGATQIMDAYSDGIEYKRFSKFINIDKIKEYNYSLNPIEYLDFDDLNNSFKKSVSLKEIATINRGVQLSKKDIVDQMHEGEYCFISLKEIDDEGNINYSEASKINSKRDSWIGKFDIKPGDILLTYKGPSIKVGIVEDNFKPSFISSNLTRIRVDPEKYNPQVLFEFLKTDVAKKMMEGLQSATAIKLINIPKLEKVEVPAMDKKEMNLIGSEIKNARSLYSKVILEARTNFEIAREKYLNKLNFK